MMLHHVSVGVRDIERAAKFYDQVFKALGFKRVMEFLPHAIAYGDDHPEFWIGPPFNGQAPSIGNGVHFSFVAPSKQAVNAFHAAAMKAGGTDEGAPGPRPDYGPAYYGGFCRDLDGNKLEAAIVPAAEKSKSAKAKPKKAAAPAKRSTKPARGSRAKSAKTKAKRRR